MLRAGGSLAEIGQVLRHQHPQTTAIYAKVDREALRRIARPWPGVIS
jgi:site-specific recombinase XerD